MEGFNMTGLAHITLADHFDMADLIPMDITDLLPFDQLFVICFDQGNEMAVSNAAHILKKPPDPLWDLVSESSLNK